MTKESFPMDGGVDTTGRNERQENMNAEYRAAAALASEISAELALRQDLLSDAVAEHDRTPADQRTIELLEEAKGLFDRAKELTTLEQ